MLGYKQAEPELDEFSDEEIGKQLKKMRKRKGWSQEKMSAVMHISRSNISRMESGKLAVKYREFVKWAKSTQSQDLAMSLFFNIDLSIAADMVSNIQSVGTSILIIIGGLI
ncbi:helix-turn-helix domain-containing protein [Oceanobacillus kimchii]|uniref:helix-turn-helix domain-containing protein n=1 Tax=Oceanobacillus kimchii TaxID=746691 RepID=UPI0021A904F6|nr:helix-turn-helix transcriptional regulator [Oceanobacillus kimchii]MCT1577979.1 helix-turn-helix domain-containing protein [Oceanobacillus kimchii]MCT2137539.1 helix-turn-helix domain-containing protein [Oceanobacillus kimchii]